jgi:hypothetical protein
MQEYSSIQESNLLQIRFNSNTSKYIHREELRLIFASNQFFWAKLAGSETWDPPIYIYYIVVPDSF